MPSELLFVVFALLAVLQAGNMAGSNTGPKAPTKKEVGAARSELDDVIAERNQVINETINNS